MDVAEELDVDVDERVGNLPSDTGDAGDAGEDANWKGCVIG